MRLQRFNARNILPAIVALFVLTGGAATAQRSRSKKPAGNQDFKAARQLDSAKELLQMDEEERAVKMLQNIPRMFPTSKVRFDAHVVLGKHFVKKKKFSLAIKQFTPVTLSENPVLVAEVMYEIGKCHYFLNQYNQAFSYLRKVTSDYPNSVFANQAFYYIGMCHFVQKHWKKAVDALRMVGTAVSQDDDDSRYTEAGQRFFVKIHDKDLVVLAKDGEKVKIDVTTSRGDKEVVELSVLDKKGEYYIGSIPTAPGNPTPGAGVVDIAGGEVITTSYVDSNASDGQRMVPRVYQTKVVSTATVSFTDGAFESLVKGAFLGQDAFVRVVDLDRDVTDQPDRLKVGLELRYVVKEDEDEADSGSRGVSLEDEVIEIRDSMQLEMIEAAGHSGVFTASFKVLELEPGVSPSPEDQVLHARQGDTMRVTYVDAVHIEGTDEEDRVYEARALGGSMQDVMAQVRALTDLELAGRKNIIEAKALKELAAIFRSVGLKEKSNEKAQEGLQKVEQVVLNRNHISADLVEQALQTKWELYLVIERLDQAIRTCQVLLSLFPQSTLVDQAMVKIGQANMEKGSFQKAISIFNSILRLQKSDQRDFASFMIGEAYEKMAQAEDNQRYLTSAMQAYKSCAERFPNSLFAGQSLEKVANFYLKMQDYQRAADLMSNVAQDFPDLDNMDAMLLKWAIALYRLKRYDEAYEKLSELLNEYPESPHAAKGKKYRVAIGRKLGKDANE